MEDFGKTKPTPPITHPKPIFQQASVDGHRALWVVTILMLVSSLIFYGMSARAPVQKRLVPILMSLVTTISFISYLAMATGDGRTYNHVHRHHHHDYIPDTMKLVLREVYWARFVNWILTSPLILIILSLQGGLNGAGMLVAIAADIIMFLTALIASFIGGNGRKWMWYTISCLAYLTVVYQLGYRGRRAVANKNAQTRRFFSTLTSYSLILLLIYPIIWAAGTLARKISVDSEIIVFLILDVLSQGIFGYWILFAHDRSPALAVPVDGFWSNGLTGEGEIRVGEDENA
ncbi:hypothetical protein FQN54_003877 [Arachnomyces sp. PD_36]|nr:hypothetical protein FQN54_003877 [Arachnomyces sp. PD_36]